MTYYVAVENGAANRYTARVIGWPNCVAKGATREEAIARVQQRFLKRLKQVEIVPMEVEATAVQEAEGASAHPWAKFAGMYQTNPLFEEVMSSIQTYRRELDADESVI